MKAMPKAARLLLAALAVSPALQVYAADDYPNRPIRLVIPWPPGGITDVVSRVLASELTQSMGQQVVPDNRPGAAGTVGVGIVAKAAPDGYTVLMSDVPSHAISASLYRRLPYDPVKEIEPIFLVARSPLVLVTNPKLGFKSIADVVKHAKANPDKLSFASSGPGSITHLTAERFKRDTGVKLLHVPYKGGSPATAGVVSGESGIYFSCIAAAIPHIKAGRLTLLGVTAPKRSPLYPDTPAVSEVLPGFDMGCNTGFFAPGGTPRHITSRLYNEVAKAVKQPRMKETITSNSAEVGQFTQAEFKRYVAREMKDWGEVVRAANLKVD